MSEFTEENKKYFDEQASSYNNKFAKSMKQLSDEIVNRLDWIGAEWIEEEEEGLSSSDNEEEDKLDTNPSASPSLSHKKELKILDYACGTGLLTRALAPHATHIIGLDISPNMVQEYNLRASNQGIPSSEMHAIVANLLDPLDPNPECVEGEEFWGFDVVGVGLGWHHFEDPGLAARRLGERLRVGGVLFIVDFLPHGGHSHSHSHSHPHSHNANPENSSQESRRRNTVKHHGFSRHEIEKMFLEAGVGGNFDYVEVGKGVVFEAGEKGEKRSVFMARGTKI